MPAKISKNIFRQSNEKSFIRKSKFGDIGFHSISDYRKENYKVGDTV